MFPDHDRAKARYVHCSAVPRSRSRSADIGSAHPSGAGLARCDSKRARRGATARSRQPRGALKNPTFHPTNPSQPVPCRPTVSRRLMFAAILTWKNGTRCDPTRRCGMLRSALVPSCSQRNVCLATGETGSATINGYGLWSFNGTTWKRRVWRTWHKSGTLRAHRPPTALSLRC
jgi:hypothetical protein